MHFDRDLAAARAVLTAAPLHVEREAPRAVPAHPGIGNPRHEVADGVEDVRVRGRVAPRRASDRRLVYVDDLVEVLEPLDLPMGAGLGRRLLEHARRGPVEDVVHERRLPGAGAVSYT